MKAGFTQTVPVQLQMAPLNQKASERLNFRCMGCGSRLEVHQPDQSYPNRILGTCIRCHGWVVADFFPEQNNGVMVFLPGKNFLPVLGVG